MWKILEGLVPNLFPPICTKASDRRERTCITSHINVGRLGTLQYNSFRWRAIRLFNQLPLVPKTTAYKRWNCQVNRPANRCHLIPSNCFPNGFPDPSQFAVAKLTHYSTMLHRPRQRLLLSGDVHQNPGPVTKYPCSVCTSNVTSRGVSYMCNRCFGWVHSKCSGLQNAAEYRRIKNWAYSSPPTPPIPQPSPITTKASVGDPFTILQFNANGIGYKQVELGEFLERHKVKVAVIEESKLTLNSRTPNIQNTVINAKEVVYSH